MEKLTKEQFAILAKAMKAIYPQPSFLPDSDALDLWHYMLKDIPYQILQNGIQLYMQTGKFPPTVADLREAASRFMPSELDMSDLEAWAMVRKALSNSGYHWKEEYDGLPLVIQKAIGRPENLYEWAMMDGNTVGSVIQSQFLKSYRSVLAREKENGKLSPHLRERIERRNEQQSITAATGDRAGIPEDI